MFDSIPTAVDFSALAQLPEVLDDRPGRLLVRPEALPSNIEFGAVEVAVDN